MRKKVADLRPNGRWLGTFLALVMLLTLGLTACSSDATPTPVAVSPTATPAKLTTVNSLCPPQDDPNNPVTITWSFWGDDSEVAINNRLKKQFESTCPGIRVNVLHDTWSNYPNLLRNEWVGDKAPDVMFLDNIPTWASLGILDKINPYIDRDKIDINDFYPGLLNMFRYNGSLYGLPRDNDTKVIYVNLDLLKEAGINVPQAGWTWQDLREAALKLTKRDSQGKVTQYGFAFEPNTWWRLWVWQNGGELYDSFNPPTPPTQLLLNNKAASDGVQFFADLINVDKVTPGYSDMDSSDKIAKLFADRKLAMAFGNHAQVPIYGSTNGLHWDVAPLPTGKKRANVLGGAGYGIGANSKHKDEAWAFVNWLTGPIGQALFSDTGLMVSSLKSVRENNIFLRMQPYNTQVFLQETEVGHPYPEFNFSQEVDALMDQALIPAWQGKVPVSDVFASLPAQVEPYFAKGRK
ncbi:MAG TPA: sugar ABC transporter substrate-binding protein [Chloroflexia bacterium]|nr:sugar ABC transporter substrate-binding protein [Chloroflexia bacterium]